MSAVFTVSPVLEECYAALVPFITAVTGLPAQNVVIGLGNRVPMPMDVIDTAEPGFVLVQSVNRRRLRTNLHITDGADQFVGTASLTLNSATMDVTAVTSGALAVGQVVLGPGIPPNTTIQSFGTGSGGIGTYVLSAVASADETAVEVVVGPGLMTLEEGVELTLQIDCYSFPVQGAGQSAEDWATMLSTTLRDEYGCTQLAPTLQPLYADEARMIPLVAGEDQYEERWSLDARFQYNPRTVIPEQYAEVLALELVNIEEAYPA